jgi:hypothetical protein
MHSDLDREGALARLLRELPDDVAEPYGFGEFQRRARQRPLSRRTGATGAPLAVAAAIAVAVVALWTRFDAPTPRPQAAAAAAEPSSRAEAPVTGAPPVSAAAMERWLASLPREPALARVGNRAAVTGLEDRIAQLDDLLSAARAEQGQPAQVLALQQERTRLVGALVQVRYAETLADASR